MRHFPAYQALGHGGRISLLEGGLDNLNLLLTDPTGVPQFVARHYLLSSIPKIAGEIRLVCMLASNEYPTPSPLPTTTGEWFLERQNEPAIALFPYIEGAVEQVWSLEQKQTAASAIADFHRLCRQNRFRIGMTKQRMELLQSGSSKIAALNIRGHETLAADLDQFLNRRLENQWQRFQSLPFGPVHHDLNYGNVIWQGKNIGAIIDFDECHDAPLIMDLVAAFSYLAVNADDQLDFDSCRAILAGYEQVRPLEPDEIQLLPFAWDLLNLVGSLEYLLGNADKIELCLIVAVTRFCIANSGREYKSSSITHDDASIEFVTIPINRHFLRISNHGCDFWTLSSSATRIE